MEQLIARINEAFTGVKFSTLNFEDERELLRIAAAMFMNAKKRGEIADVPGFYLDSGPLGYVVVVAEGSGGNA